VSATRQKIHVADLTKAIHIELTCKDDRGEGGASSGEMRGDEGGLDGEQWLAALKEGRVSWGDEGRRRMECLAGNTEWVVVPISCKLVFYSI